MKRFAAVSDDDIEVLSKTKYRRNTETMTKYTLNLFQQFLEEFYPQFSVETISKEDFIPILKHFYASIKTGLGSSFSMSSLNQIKYSLRRHILDLRKIDITNDPLFSEVNITFKNVLKKVIEEGKGIVKHHEDINKEDCQKVIATLSTENPIELQLLTWFFLMIHFCRRGMENLSEMKKDHFIVKIIDGKKCVVQSKSELQKNSDEHHIREAGAIMGATGSAKCPVSTFETYLSKLTWNSSFLWQLPKSKFNEKNWYHRKCGKNTLKNFMVKISELCSLSTKYTNHCIRATAITSLGKVFSDIDIQSVSGHRSLSSLAIYKRVENEKKFEISNVISDLYSKNEDKQTVDLDDDDINLLPEVEIILNEIEGKNVTENQSTKRNYPVFNNCQISNILLI